MFHLKRRVAALQAGRVMPLRVSVELERGDGTRETLATLRIVNVGGTEQLGDYVVFAMHGRRRKEKGIVFGHRRLAEPVWVLVAKALKSLGYEL